MLDVNALSSALISLASDPQIWVMMVAGLFIGLIAGSIAGVSTTMAMAICLPLTLYMEFMPAIMFLTAIFTGGGFGGAVTSILMGIPGTTSAVATTFDGYPMTRKGQHNEALGLALAASVIGVLIGYAVLLLIVAPLGRWVIRLGPAEMLMVALWGMTMIAMLGGKSLSRGIIAGALGLLLGTVGMSTSGYIRGTNDIPFLLDGIPAIPAMMGLFAASQLFTLIGAGFLIEDKTARRADYRKVLSGFRSVFRHPWEQIRGTLIGVFVGAIPGVGSSVGNLISYAQAKRAAKNPETFGTGDPRGVIAAESANSSSEGGSMVTMLALGLPGGGGTAILLAAFAIHNVPGGPGFINRNIDVVYTIVVGNFIQAILLIFAGLAFLTVAGNMVRVPLTWLIPSVLVLAVFGAFAVTGDASGPMTLFVFAAIGWLMKRYDYPIAACVVGLLIGRMVESELIRTYQISGGELSFLLTRPVAMAFAILLVLSLLQPLFVSGFRRFLQARSAAR
jgi:putative tricarboxylic transport membrane protein